MFCFTSSSGSDRLMRFWRTSASASPAAGCSRRSISTCRQRSVRSFWRPRESASCRAGYDPDYYFIEDRASDVPYYNYYTAEGAEPKSRIYVEDGYARPRIREITEVSEVVRGLQRGYELHRVCFPAEVKAEVYELYHNADAKRPIRLRAVSKSLQIIWRLMQWPE